MKTSMCGVMGGMALAVLSTSADAQTWNYQSYTQANGVMTKAAPGYVALMEEGGKAKVRFTIPNPNICTRSDAEALVERTDTQIIITTFPSLRGCDGVRLVIKADGSGGYREDKKGDEWARDGLERWLTLR